MPKDTRKRVKLTFSKEQYRKATKVRKALFPYPLESAGFRDVLMYLHDNLGAIQDFVTSGAHMAPEVPKGDQMAPGVTYPDPVRAPESSTQVVVVSEKTTTDVSPVAEIAALFTELDWRDAVLPQRTTPEKFAQSLLDTFPKKNLDQEIRRAQIWHLDRKPSWKRLGHSLSTWLAKPTPAWEKDNQQPLFDKPTPLDESQAHSGAYDKNGRWTKDIP